MASPSQDAAFGAASYADYRTSGADGSPSEFKRRLNLALVHYSYVRPHSPLGGMTPIEVYYGIRGHIPRPVFPPRGQIGESGPEVPFDFMFFDSEHQMLPMLFEKAAFGRRRSIEVLPSALVHQGAKRAHCLPDCPFR